MKQATIKEPFSVNGIGLHTGHNLSATFLPADEDTGIRFIRIDAKTKPIIPAAVSFVNGTERGTVIEKDGYRISTIEHALSALYGMNISNCTIEVSGDEIPILDGSAAPYVDLISKVGIQEQRKERKKWIVDKEYTFEDGTSKICIRPNNTYQISVKVQFPPAVVGEQEAHLFDLNAYAKDIAEARTFCFVREIEPLLHNNLIKGGDLKNALVIYDEPLSQNQMDELTDKLSQPHMNASKLGYLSKLRYPNEIAVHKLLDLIGDLSLLGIHIQGDIYAQSPGHSFNTRCGKYLLPFIGD